MIGLIAPTINLLILIGVLYYFLREPVKAHVSTRHQTMRNELEKVRDLFQEAKREHEDFSAKLSSLRDETQRLREQMSQDSQAARQRLVADAQRLSLAITADAHAGVQGLYQDLRSQLSSELGHRIVMRAERLLRERLTGADREHLKNEFSKQVEMVQ